MKSLSVLVVAFSLSAAIPLNYYSFQSPLIPNGYYTTHYNAAPRVTAQYTPTYYSPIVPQYAPYRTVQAAVLPPNTDLGTKDDPFYLKPATGSSKAGTPSAAAALAYMTAVGPTDICGQTMIAFVQQVLAGADYPTAYKATSDLYVQLWNQGLRPAPGSACEASDKAWQAAEAAGQDPVYASAAAFMNNFPGQANSPCHASGMAYVQNLLNGADHITANRLATQSFANTLRANAQNGNPILDPACIAATKAYLNHLDAPPSPPNAAAMNAFMDKALQQGALFQADDICWESTVAFIDAFAAGNSELDSNLIAAEKFLEKFAEGSYINPDSPCAAATLAYADAISNKPSEPNAAAMVAFMQKMIADGARQPDPVCAASTIAYWKAYRAGESETDSNLAAAKAFQDAFASGLNIPADSPCLAATVAYAQALPQKPSEPNAAAMLAFAQKMVQGGTRQPDPACAAATTAFYDSYAAGNDELTSNLNAAKAFFKAFQQRGISVPADSPCAAATRAYADATKNKPSSPNANAMKVFMDEWIAQGASTIDPACALSAEAYFDAYLGGATELQANKAAGLAFLNYANGNANFDPKTPCGKSAIAYMESIGLEVDF